MKKPIGGTRFAVALTVITYVVTVYGALKGSKKPKRSR